MSGDGEFQPPVQRKERWWDEKTRREPAEVKAKDGMEVKATYRVVNVKLLQCGGRVVTPKLPTMSA